MKIDSNFPSTIGSKQFRFMCLKKSIISSISKYDLIEKLDSTATILRGTDDTRR